MLFSGDYFLLAFLPAVLIGYYLIFRNRTAGNYFLLFASLFFYAWGNPFYVLLMIFSIIANYLFGRLIGRSSDGGRKRLFLILSIIVNLGILFYFKYFNFTVDIINSILHTEFYVKQVELPIGISFFTFQAMSYVFDVYRGTAEVQKNPFYLGLYISFFPQLIAGPIVRYNSVSEQIEHRTVDMEKFQQGVSRFIIGFSKKIILANMLSISAEKAFGLASGGEISSAMAWLGAFSYTFQIFFDFSGYSDMAIGLGKMFGFEFEENFRYPYVSKSVSEFWNRWHISLGHWFRDYVYFPMGGSRVAKPVMIRNLFVVWLLTGIWHGAAWQFILWGVGYGVIISFEKLTDIPKKFKNRTAVVLYGCFTFLVVVIGWVIFGSADLPSALTQLRSMFGFGAAGLCDNNAIYAFSEYKTYLLLAVIFSTPLPKLLISRIKHNTAYELCRTFVLIMLLVISISYLSMTSHNPFIYFNF